MVGKLLVRGLLVGLVAGLLAFGFARIFGEPAVDKGIAFESAQDKVKADAKFKADVEHAKAAHLPAPQPAQEEPELVSRAVQSNQGLLTGTIVVGTALGGIFALVFAFAYGRMGVMGPRATAAALSVMAFVSIYFVPNLKYPSNPPGTSEAETIGARTGLYFSMILLSVIAMVLAVMLFRRLQPRLGGWNASIASGVAYIAVMAVVMLLLPTVNEVPETFPAVALWDFRMSTMGVYAILWGVIGLAFGALSVPAMAADRRLVSAARHP